MTGVVNQAQYDLSIRSPFPTLQTNTLPPSRQAASGATSDAQGTVARTGDEAKGGLPTGRRGNNAVATDGDEDDDPPGDPKEDREKPSSLKIHIKLNLDVEVHLTARVKGDVTIGLL